MSTSKKHIEVIVKNSKKKRIPTVFLNLVSTSAQVIITPKQINILIKRKKTKNTKLTFKYKHTYTRRQLRKIRSISYT
jgi:hypothetical protein